MAGSLSVQGTQTNVPTGSVTIGPFSIPLSSVELSQTIIANITTPINFAAGAAMCVIAPSGLSGGNISVGTGGTASGAALSYSQPSFLAIPAGASGLIITTAGLTPGGSVQVLIC